MKYGILLWPHANSRYQQAVGPLALGEANLMLMRLGIEANARMESVAGVEFVVFDADTELTDRQIALLSRHSALYLLGRMDEDGKILPITSRAEAYLGYDLAGILKYKGKTNESFTRFLINIALLSSAFTDQFDDAV